MVPKLKAANVLSQAISLVIKDGRSLTSVITIFLQKRIKLCWTMAMVWYRKDIGKTQQCYGKYTTLLETQKDTE